MLNGNSRNADKFVVRLPTAMRERIAEIAKANHRSMNSEIVRSLESLVENGATAEDEFRPATTAEEARALEAFRKLSAGKRKALMLLLASDQ